MRSESPKLDNRTSSDIYRQAIAAAKVYLPEWIREDAEPDFFNPADTGLVILKLLSRLTESTLSQLNCVPDKHKLAFFDLLGVDLLPARASKVPLTFNLSKGAASALVKKGTQVASKEDDKVIFETEEDLSLWPVSIVDSFSFDPWRDRYTVHEKIMQKSDKYHSLFGYDENEKKCPHRLFIRNDLLFNVEASTELTVDFEFPAYIDAMQVSPLFKEWHHESRPATLSSQSSAANILTSRITLSACAKSEMEDGEHWISVSPDPPVEMSEWDGKIPQVSKIILSYSSDPLSPGLLFSDNVPLEAEKGFYPFQKAPEPRMSFYMGDNNIFNKKGADISVNIVCDTIKLSSDDPAPVLEWEYWDGKKWASLSVIDNTGHFTSKGNITFKAPDIQRGKVNGKENRWIRARLKEGSYGRAGHYVLKAETKEEYLFTPPTYNPPFISEIKLAYSYTNIEPLEIKTENYLHERALDHARPFVPYEIKSSEYPAFYFASNEPFHSRPLSFFFQLKKRLFNEKWNTVQKPGVDPELITKSSMEWQYFNGKNWSKIDNLKDGTSLVTDEGIINFIMPHDASQTEVFGKTRYWLRLCATSGNYSVAPRIKGIFPNSVNALNRIEMKDEVLASSNGKPDQVVRLSRSPVLEGQIIEVIEPESLSEDEIEELEGEAGKGAVTENFDDRGNVRAFKVRWCQVGDFTMSGPKGRHYTINRISGEIKFGNGKNGLIPPKGRNNIIAKNYKIGGGTSGNVPAGILSSLKTATPNVESVISQCESFGGTNQEILNDLIKRAPYTVKTKNRAVTAEDYEWLAKEADPMVYRSRCIRVDDGKVRVVVMPKSEVSSPLPTAQMIKTIREYLVERSLFTLGADIEVIGPSYKIINVRVVFKLVNINVSMSVRGKLINEIKSFFHSITGNVDGNGWDFGRDIYSSDLSARLESIPGVDYIKEINLSCLPPGDPFHLSVTGIGNIPAAEDEIVSCGKAEAIAEA